MLYDTLTPEEAVDAEAAREFMKEATKLASAQDLEDIGQRLEEKSVAFRRLLGPETIDELTEEGFEELLGWIFSLRRKARRLIRANGFDVLRDALRELLYGDGSPGGRIERFAGTVAGLEPATILSLGTETLHFSEPGRYWLWTHWIWKPEKGTGALPLVIQSEVALEGDSLGARYMSVGHATALVNAQGQVAGWARSGRDLFGTDIFLACVYSVYMYTVFRMRLSQEFNRILPELPELVRRVLGVNRKGVTDGG